MVDTVRPLKIERTTSGGTQNDKRPTETDPNEDYLATKGIAFESNENFLVDKIGRVLSEKYPDLYESYSYDSSDRVSTITYYNSSSFVEANRVALMTMTYTNDDLTSEVMNIYDTDGTTILRTYTWTHTYTSNVIQSSSVVIS